MSQQRPKPWEAANGNAASPNANNDPLPLHDSLVSDVRSTPEVPPKPSSVPSSTNESNTLNGSGGYGNGGGSTYTSTYGSGYNNYGTSYSGYGGYGGIGGYSSGLGGYGGMGGYSSGLGGYGGMSRYGMGGMGSYGGYGGMYGMGGMGVGMNGISSQGQGQGGMMDATARTFQVLENVVYAVSALAALLESTYYATHNSFFTILGVADQLGGVGGAIKNTISGAVDSTKLIGSASFVDGTSGSNSNRGPLGIYALLSWLKRLIKKILGFSSSPSSRNGSRNLLEEFTNWRSGIQAGSTNPQNNGKNKLSLKPLFAFLIALVGMPVLMSKFVRYIERHQREKIKGAGINFNGNSSQKNADVNTPNGRIDPRSLEFARATYDYIPEREDEQAGGWKELKLSRGDLVAIISKVDGWSHCRSRDGRVGFVPTNYLEIIKRPERGKPVTKEKNDAKTEQLVK
ncbi:uncharacterized protein C5L36_0E01590 [Pichia kudriavzevii]|uniref:Peroxisomal membrane protein PEX13 n=1 Tax=Pichia kudriavzevii TaxID=4909 RepID=A0A2U9RAP6_PICKU|nr:uncharacterized protein C5L36_0E01590 [Pichia kudriavzevii]AWU78096.1 hypothetical protein C5L36_0E01590 [Pichia kudriavzevii]